MTQKLYEIVIAPDPVLKTQASPVEHINAQIASQIDRMMETMYEGSGIGLAANQVNMLNRVLVMDVPKGVWEYKGEDRNGVLTIGSAYKSGNRDEEQSSQPIAMVNPEVIWQSEQRSVYDEGCLSLPGQYAQIERSAKVRVKYLDKAGQEREDEFAGLDSHCVQHEIDHLNGVLFTDYLSRLKRNTILRRVEKAKKSQQML